MLVLSKSREMIRGGDENGAGSVQDPEGSFQERHAGFGRAKRWISPGSQRSSRNLRASLYATKQARFGDKRLWWFMIAVHHHSTR